MFLYICNTLVKKTIIKKFHLALMLLTTFITFSILFAPTLAYGSILPDEDSSDNVDTGNANIYQSNIKNDDDDDGNSPSILDRIINQTARIFKKEDTTSIDIKNKLRNYVNHFLRDKSLENITISMQLIDTITWDITKGKSNESADNNAAISKPNRNYNAASYYIYNIFIDSNMTADFHLDRSFYVVTNGQVILSSMVDVNTHEDIVESKLSKKYTSSQLSYNKLPLIIGNGKSKHKLVIFSTFDSRPSHYLLHKLTENELSSVDIYFVNIGTDNLNTLLNKIMLLGLKNGYNFSSKIFNDIDKLKTLSSENVINAFGQYVPEKKIFTEEMNDIMKANAEYGLHVYRKLNTNVSPMLIFDNKLYYMFDDNFIENVNTIDRKARQEQQQAAEAAAIKQIDDGASGR